MAIERYKFGLSPDGINFDPKLIDASTVVDENGVSVEDHFIDTTKHIPESVIDDKADAALAAAKTFVASALTGYLTEQEVYDAISEAAQGLFKDCGSVSTRSELPLTADDFDLYHIEDEGDEGVDVYARNIDSTLVWLALTASVDLSTYETTVGATEKSDAALAAAKVYTDDIADGLLGKLDTAEAAKVVPWTGISGKPTTWVGLGIDDTVSKLEAKAGTSTTVKGWTAERVREAALAAAAEVVNDLKDIVFVSEESEIAASGVRPGGIVMLAV